MDETLIFEHLLCLAETNVVFYLLGEDLRENKCKDGQGIGVSDIYSGVLQAFF